jgi:two-component system, OmpR family, phosphate regulon response regulator PhoB
MRIYSVTDETQATILVVDDDPALQRLVVALLKRAGMDAFSAMNAMEAAEHLKQGAKPDLMVLDLMMPEISGIEFLHDLRLQSEYDYLPVIILSALADPEKIREGLDAGADRYLTKPYLANNLVKTVNEVLEQGRRAK